jgi:two-component system chemotaxis response regulator CheY
MSRRVLIVEDATFVSEIIKSHLLQAEYDVIGVARDGLNAIELAELHQPDLIIMDLILPYKNGVEVAKHLTVKFPKLKIIAISSLIDEKMKILAIDAGCIDFIDKPFTKDALLNSVNNVLNDSEDQTVA